ncbi:MAG: VTT domain-containing protein, partial [Planctomycetota bacterium]
MSTVTRAQDERIADRSRSMGLVATANKHASTIRSLSILMIVVALIVVASALPVGQAMDVLRVWIDDLGVLGPVVFALIYIVATVLFLPGLILTLASGALFGLVTGTIAVSLGSTIGAACAFLIARYFAREKVAEIAGQRPKFNAIDRAIGEGGWKIVAMLRLSPAIPFNLQNYLYGLTPIRFWPYVLTSWIAMLPGTFMYVYIGHLTGAVAGGGQRERTLGEWVLLGVGLLATIVVSYYITALARQKLRGQADLAGSETPPPPVEKSTVVERRGWPWGAMVTAMVAVLCLGAATYARLNPQVLTGMFGPPAVTMSEAYQEQPEGPSVDHAAFDALLRQHVDADGWVDYDGLRRDQVRLDAYLKMLADAPFDELGRDEKLALLINAYNAFTLKLILDNPGVDSIRKIDKPWDGPTYVLGGNRWSLNQIEHEQIRPMFKEPRIHFALVCAAVGCPPLRSEAYVAKRLEEQLDEQMRYAHRRGTWARFDAAENTLYLTQLYNWYGDDFTQVVPSIVDYVATYVAGLEAAASSAQKPRIKWLDYDWALNS